MDAIGARKVIYNISWEDPAIDMDCMKVGKEDKVLTISSAGCNALDYLVQGCEAVVAADLNEAQLACLELKLAGFKELEYDDFFKLWGESDFKVFERVYQSKLRKHLTPSSKSFWVAAAMCIYGSSSSSFFLGNPHSETIFLEKIDFLRYLSDFFGHPFASLSGGSVVTSSTESSIISISL